MKIIFISILTVLALIMLSCSRSSDSNGNEIVRSDPKKVQIYNEITRLMSLAGNDNISEEDFSSLNSMIGDDDKEKDEINEIKTMVKYKEFGHAAHGLSFLFEYVGTEKEVLCPGHSLSHYYIFHRHGEYELAGESLKEAKENLEDWIPKGRKYLKEYPNGEKFDDVVNKLNMHLKNIDNGIINITNSDLDYLDDKASICVEG